MDGYVSGKNRTAPLKTEWMCRLSRFWRMAHSPSRKSCPPEETGDRMDAEIIVPDGFDGWLPVYALGTKEYYDRIRLEWFDSSELVQKQKGEGRIPMSLLMEDA